MGNDLSIYLHIPFCRSKCPYCNFYSLESPVNPKLWDNYKAAVLRQLGTLISRFRLAHRTVTSLYIGGGTPSVVGAELLRSLIEGIDRYLGLDMVEEVTIELNPADVRPNLLRQYRDFGVTRVSLGVQSFNEKKLTLLGRRHNAREALASINICRDVFGDNISIDLIFGLPGEDLSIWKTDLDVALSLKVNHISLYSLSIEEGTPFYQKYRGFENDWTSAQMYVLADRLLSSVGIRWYEISNFSLPGRESYHNLRYWLGGDFIGLGPSAWSYVDGVRFSVRPDLNAFLKFKMEYEKDILPASRRLKEEKVLQLRTRYGIDKEGIPDGWVDRIMDFVKMRWIEEIDNKYVLTLQGRLFADEIATNLIY